MTIGNKVFLPLYVNGKIHRKWIIPVLGEALLEHNLVSLTFKSSNCPSRKIIKPIPYPSGPSLQVISPFPHTSPLQKWCLLSTDCPLKIWAKYLCNSFPMPFHSGDCSSINTRITIFCGQREILAGGFYLNGTKIHRNDWNPTGICRVSLGPQWHGK